MKNPHLKKARNFLFYILMQAVRLAVFFMPWRAAPAVGAFLGYITRLLAKKEVKKALKNMDIVYTDKIDAKQKERLIKDNFTNYGIGLFEFMKFTHWTPAKTASLVRETKGLEHIEAAFKKSKSVICVTAHYSNWEIMPVYMSTLGYRVGVIGKKLFDPMLDSVLGAARRKAGIRIYDRDTPPRELVRDIKQGIMLGVLVDQDTRVESITAPFLGRPAKTPVIPARLAVKYKAAIMTVFISRIAGGYYRLEVNPAYKISEDTLEEDLVKMYNDDISKRIIKEPSQWAWVHDRWKSV